MKEPRPYTSPTAFRRALTDKLKALAATSKWSFAQLQRQMAYDRLLERLYLVDEGWVVKGAAALLARDLGVRETVDVDVYRALATDVAEMELRAAAATDMTMTGAPEDVPPLARVVMPNVIQHGYRAYPLVDHIADKVAAILQRYGPQRMRLMSHSFAFGLGEGNSLRRTDRPLCALGEVGAEVPSRGLLVTGQCPGIAGRKRSCPAPPREGRAEAGQGRRPLSRVVRWPSGHYGRSGGASGGPVTTISPLVPVCQRQWYRKTPGSSKARPQRTPGPKAGEVKESLSATSLWTPRTAG
jgi:hypothetical protein